ncbi:hypothetical protein RCL1_006637 [Eukaryota sp. TZLM3-RCL]
MIRNSTDLYLHLKQALHAFEKDCIDEGQRVVCMISEYMEHNPGCYHEVVYYFDKKLMSTSSPTRTIGIIRLIHHILFATIHTFHKLVKKSQVPEMLKALSNVDPATKPAYRMIKQEHPYVFGTVAVSHRSSLVQSDLEELFVRAATVQSVGEKARDEMARQQLVNDLTKFIQERTLQDDELAISLQVLDQLNSTSSTSLLPQQQQQQLLQQVPQPVPIMDVLSDFGPLETRLASNVVEPVIAGLVQELTDVTITEHQSNTHSSEQNEVGSIEVAGKKKIVETTLVEVDEPPKPPPREKSKTIPKRKVIELDLLQTQQDKEEDIIRPLTPPSTTHSRSKLLLSEGEQVKHHDPTSPIISDILSLCEEEDEGRNKMEEVEEQENEDILSFVLQKPPSSMD